MVVLDGKSIFLNAGSCALFSSMALAGGFAVLRMLVFFSAVLLSTIKCSGKDSW